MPLFRSTWQIFIFDLEGIFEIQCTTVKPVKLQMTAILGSLFGTLSVRNRVSRDYIEGLVILGMYKSIVVNIPPCGVYIARGGRETARVGACQRDLRERGVGRWCDGVPEHGLGPTTIFISCVPDRDTNINQVSGSRTCYTLRSL